MDTTFDPGIGPDYAVCAIAQQKDGKVLIGGMFTNVSRAGRPLIARLNEDGSLDTSFRSNHFSSSPSSAIIYTIAVAEDGKVLVGGSFQSVNSSSRNGIARPLPDGTLDSNLVLNAPSPLVVGSIIVQSRSNFVVGGWIGEFQDGAVPF